MVCGSCWLRLSSPQPVEPFAPASTFFHVLPPSVVLKTPRSSLSFQRWPVAQTSTVLPLLGSTEIFAMCSASFSPTLLQFSPPSVDLLTPSPTETLLRVQDSPEP